MGYTEPAKYIEMLFLVFTLPVFFQCCISNMCENVKDLFKQPISGTMNQLTVISAVEQLSGYIWNAQDINNGGEQT